MGGSEAVIANPLTIPFVGGQALGNALSQGPGATDPGAYNAGITEQDLQEFASTSYATGVDIGALKNAQIYKNGATDINGNRVGSTYDLGVQKFGEFIRARDTQRKQHEEYVKATQDRPGRKATILTTDLPKTVLG